MGGQACIRGMRIPVVTIVGMVRDGMSTDEIVDAYPQLEAADVDEALRWAAEADPELPVVRVLTRDEFNEMLRDAPPPTPDDVSVTRDGRRLDSKEAVLAFIAELDAERAAGG